MSESKLTQGLRAALEEAAWACAKCKERLLFTFYETGPTELFAPYHPGEVTVRMRIDHTWDDGRERVVFVNIVLSYIGVKGAMWTLPRYAKKVHCA